MNYAGLFLALLGVLGQIAASHGYNAINQIVADPATADTLAGAVNIALILLGGAHSAKKTT